MGQSVCKCCNCTTADNVKRKRRSQVYPTKPLSADCIWNQGSSIPSSIQRPHYYLTDSDLNSLFEMGENEMYIKKSKDEATACADIITELFSGNTRTSDISDLPVFIRKLKDITLKVGTRARLIIELISKSEFTVTWYRNQNQILTGEEHQLLHEGNIYCVDIPCVTIQDNGRWSCNAQNSQGRVITSCYVQVAVPKSYKKPVFYEELEAILTPEGTVSLQCKVVGVPTPILRWFKDGTEIKAGDMFALAVNSKDPVSLGTYTCEASNCMGKSYSSSRVNVSGRSSRADNVKEVYSILPSGQPPIFTHELKNEKVKIGETLVLSCQLAVPPWPKSVKWYSPDGKEINTEEGRFKSLADGIGGYILELIQTNECDRGIWKCVAISQDSSVAVSTSDVNVWTPKNYRKPYFVEKLKAVLTEDGLVSFECKVVGYPTPCLRWFKDGSELKAGDIYQLTGVSSLGSYVCIAKNCMGEVSSEAELTVEDIQQQLTVEENLLLSAIRKPPKFIRKLCSCEVQINTNFKFSIEVQTPPVPKVTWYKDDQIIYNEPNKYVIGAEKNGIFYISISKLEIVDQAEWKCIATNEFGRTETSCYLKLTIPKYFKKPKFLESLKAVLSDDGIVNLECKVIGVPQPVLKWYKDGVELNPGDIHKIMSGQDGTCCLGMYTCEARNCMGAVTSSASIHGIEDTTPKPTRKLIENTRKLSLSTINEEESYKTPDEEPSLLLDQPHEVSYSFDGKEISVSFYDSPDLTHEEALQIVEMYADQLSEHISEHKVVELPPLRIVKETSTASNICMEGVVIDVVPEYFTVGEEDQRTEADIEDISVLEDTLHSSKMSRIFSDEEKWMTSDNSLNSPRISGVLSEEANHNSYEPNIRSANESIKSPDLYYSLTESKKELDAEMSCKSFDPDTETFISAKSFETDKQSANRPEDLKQYEAAALFIDSPERSRSTAATSYVDDEAVFDTGLQDITHDFRALHQNIQFLVVLLANNLTEIQQRLCYTEREMFLHSLKQYSISTQKSLDVLSGLIKSIQDLRKYFVCLKDNKNKIKNNQNAIELLFAMAKDLQQNINVLKESALGTQNEIVQKNCVKIIYQTGESFINILDLISDVLKYEHLNNSDTHEIIDEPRQKVIDTFQDIRYNFNEIFIQTNELCMNTHEEYLIELEDIQAIEELEKQGILDQSAILIIDNNEDLANYLFNDSFQINENEINRNGITITEIDENNKSLICDTDKNQAYEQIGTTDKYMDNNSKKNLKTLTMEGSIIELIQYNIKPEMYNVLSKIEFLFDNVKSSGKSMVNNEDKFIAQTFDIMLTAEELTMQLNQIEMNSDAKISDIVEMESLLTTIDDIHNTTEKLNEIISNQTKQQSEKECLDSPSNFTESIYQMRNNIQTLYDSLLNIQIRQQTNETHYMKKKLFEVINLLKNSFDKIKSEPITSYYEEKIIQTASKKNTHMHSQLVDQIKECMDKLDHAQFKNINVHKPDELTTENNIIDKIYETNHIIGKITTGIEVLANTENINKPYNEFYENDFQSNYQKAESLLKSLNKLLIESINTDNETDTLKEEHTEKLNVLSEENTTEISTIQILSKLAIDAKKQPVESTDLIGEKMEKGIMETKESSDMLNDDKSKIGTANKSKQEDSKEAVTDQNKKVHNILIDAEIQKTETNESQIKKKKKNEEAVQIKEPTNELNNVEEPEKYGIVTSDISKQELSTTQKVEVGTSDISKQKLSTEEMTDKTTKAGNFPIDTETQKAEVSESILTKEKLDMGIVENKGLVNKKAEKIEVGTSDISKQKLSTEKVIDKTTKAGNLPIDAKSQKAEVSESILTEEKLDMGIVETTGLVSESKDIKEAQKAKIDSSEMSKQKLSLEETNDASKKASTLSIGAEIQKVEVSESKLTKEKLDTGTVETKEATGGQSDVNKKAEKVEVGTSDISKQKLSTEEMTNKTIKAGDLLIDAESQEAETSESKLIKEKLDTGTIETKKSTNEFVDNKDAQKIEINTSGVSKQKLSTEKIDKNITAGNLLILADGQKAEISESMLLNEKQDTGTVEHRISVSEFSEIKEVQKAEIGASDISKQKLSLQKTNDTNKKADTVSIGVEIQKVEISESKLTKEKLNTGTVETNKSESEFIGMTQAQKLKIGASDISLAESHKLEGSESLLSKQKLDTGTVEKSKSASEVSVIKKAQIAEIDSSDISKQKLSLEETTNTSKKGSTSSISDEVQKVDISESKLIKNELNTGIVETKESASDFSDLKQAQKVEIGTLDNPKQKCSKQVATETDNKSNKPLLEAENQKTEITDSTLTKVKLDKDTSGTKEPVIEVSGVKEEQKTEIETSNESKQKLTKKATDKQLIKDKNQKKKMIQSKLTKEKVEKVMTDAKESTSGLSDVKDAQKVEIGTSDISKQKISTEGIHDQKLTEGIVETKQSISEINDTKEAQKSKISISDISKQNEIENKCTTITIEPETRESEITESKLLKGKLEKGKAEIDTSDISKQKLAKQTTTKGKKNSDELSIKSESQEVKVTESNLTKETFDANAMKINESSNDLSDVDVAPKPDIGLSDISKHKLEKQATTETEKKSNKIIIQEEIQEAEITESKVTKGKVNKGTVKTNESVSKLSDVEEAQKIKLGSSGIPKQNSMSEQVIENQINVNKQIIDLETQKEISKSQLKEQNTNKEAEQKINRKTTLGRNFPKEVVEDKQKQVTETFDSAHIKNMSDKIKTEKDPKSKTKIYHIGELDNVELSNKRVTTQSDQDKSQSDREKKINITQSRKYENNFEMEKASKPLFMKSLGNKTSQSSMKEKYEIPKMSSYEFKNNTNTCDISTKITSTESLIPNYGKYFTDVNNRHKIRSNADYRYKSKYESPSQHLNQNSDYTVYSKKLKQIDNKMLTTNQYSKHTSDNLYAMSNKNLNTIPSRRYSNTSGMANVNNLIEVKTMLQRRQINSALNTFGKAKEISNIIKPTLRQTALNKQNYEYESGQKTALKVHEKNIVHKNEGRYSKKSPIEMICKNLPYMGLYLHEYLGSIIEELKYYNGISYSTLQTCDYPRRYDITLIYGAMRYYMNTVRELPLYKTKILKKDTFQEIKVNMMKFTSDNKSHLTKHKYLMNDSTPITNGTLILGKYGKPLTFVSRIKTSYTDPIMKMREKCNQLNIEKTNIQQIRRMDNFLYVHVAPFHNKYSVFNYKTLSRSRDLESVIPTKNYDKFPRFISKPNCLVSVVTGQDIVISFEINNDSQPKVSWTKRNQDVTLSPRFSIESYGNYRKLILKKATFNDMGTYCLTINNNYGVCRTYVTVTVDKIINRNSTNYKDYSIQSTSPVRLSNINLLNTQSKSSVSHLHSLYSTEPTKYIKRQPYNITPPVFYLQPHNIVAELGDTIQFQCTIGGFPVPMITWYKNNRIIYSGSRVNITEKFNTRILQILQTSQNDAGSYSVTIQNEAGRAEAFMKLDLIIIKKKPYYYQLRF